MSDFSQFMKKNKLVAENEHYAATKSLCDKDGNPLEWELRHISSKEYDQIRESCTKQVPVKGKPGMYTPRVSGSELTKKIIVAAVVVPDLYDAALQDSYGVKDPEDLLTEMVDNPGEYSDFSAFVQTMNGFDLSFDDEVEEAKNSSRAGTARQTTPTTPSTSST